MPMTTLNDQLHQAATLLKRHKRPLLIAHPRPDGDTVGSTLALRLALLRLGKSPVIACVHPIPPTLNYLPGADAFVTEAPDDVDMVVAVDMSDLKRTGGIYRDAWRGVLPLLVVDHHATNDDFGDVNVVMPTAAATAIPMRRLIETMGVAVDAEIATCLLTGVLTDTRGLRTASTTPAVLAFVADLIEAGGDYTGVVQRTLDAVPFRLMRAWGVAIDRLRLRDGLAWTTLPLTEKVRLNIEDHDDLNLSNFLSRIAEARISVSFLEMRDGTVKVSMRARPGYDVSQIAKALGGGGHREAAGCTLPGALDAVVSRVLPMLFEEIRRQAE